MIQKRVELSADVSNGHVQSPTGQHGEDAGAQVLASFIDDVLRRPSHADQIEWLRTEPAREAVFAPLAAPESDDGSGGDETAGFYGLDPRWQRFLAEQGIERLYSHQAEALDHVRDGKNVVVVTGTASGKSLCYNLPVLDYFLTGQKGYALYLFPTKALSQDQMRILDSYLQGLELGVVAGVFDGDTDPAMRRRLRRNGRIILTNPDMLHRSILPNHGGWAGLFAGLRYVVVDEVHSLRGIFGSNVANVIRRLRRLAHHYGAKPQFIAASATIANPRKHVECLLGEEVELVDRDGSPKGSRTYVLWNPPIEDRPDGSRFRKGPLGTAVRLLPELLKRDIRTITFCQARSTVELLLRYVWDRLRSNESTRPLADKLESYRAGYLPWERRKIEQRLFDGDLLGVVSTNALELGIDIGGLDACILIGYPGTIASFLQRSGRAGRRSRHSLVLLIGGSDPMDQYFMRHPESFFEKSAENAVIEPQNPYVLTKHLLCASYELPLSEADAKTFTGDDTPGGNVTLLRGVLEVLCQAGHLREAEQRWHYITQDFPAKKVKLRTIGEENFTIYESGSQRIIGELDYVAGLLSLYEGAIYIHRSETHFVEKLDVVNQIARIRKDDSGYYTQALCQKRVHVDETLDERNWRRTRLELSEVTVETRITGYKKVRFRSMENIGYGEVDLPPIVLPTVSVHFEIPEAGVESAMRHGADFFRSGLHGLSRLFSSLLPLFVMNDPRDMDYFIDGRRVYIYDLYEGGIGYAEKAYEIFERVLEAALAHVRSCRCDAGCPSCVLPTSTRYEIAMEPSIREFPYPREAARFLLHDLLEKEPYEPRLEAVDVVARPAAVSSHEALDPRLVRRIRRAAGTKE